MDNISKMDIQMTNNTNLSNMIISPTFIWCFLMPSVHVFSLISNILCIIVFCSNTFIKKPIAIYFICLLISDSMVLLIGYIEMIDRETSMIDKSSWLCVFNGKIIHKLTDLIYAFMGRFCLEWMLYKVLWTRVSTILLAILSVQRSRTFFSLSYHESRLCACFACIFSILIALIITCLEWISVQYETIDNMDIYYEIFQLIVNNKSLKTFYSKILYQNYNDSINNYPCMIDAFNVTSFPLIINQFNCTSSKIVSEFYNLTNSLISNRDLQEIEHTAHLLTSILPNDYNLSNNSILIDHIRTAKSVEFIPKLFEKRTCQITLSYSFWLKIFNFLDSVSFSPNRHMFAIFFGNALPSFIVVLANLVSIKVIYFSKSLKYLKQSTKKTRRKHRLQNDLRAFLVILIESFSIIMISWGIPISLTMYHCRTLYVVNIGTCPKIKDYLALFLFTDLFNSSTNCLLYSLSGKLFRRKLFCILKTIFVCGRGTLWNVKQHSLLLPNQKLERQLSNNPSTNTNHNTYSIQPSISRNFRPSERLSSQIINYQKKKSNSSLKTTATTYKRFNGRNRFMSHDGSFSSRKLSNDLHHHHDERNSSSEIESDTQKRTKSIQSRKSSQSIRIFLLDKVRSLSSTSSATSKTTTMTRPSTILTTDKQKLKTKNKIFNSKLPKRQTSTNLSISSSSFSGSASYSTQRTHSFNNRYSTSKTKLNNTVDNPMIMKDNIHENLTSL